MTTDIDPAFAERCTDAATSLRLLAELGAHPRAGRAEDVALAEQLAERILADPEALLAVALTIEQARAAAAGKEHAAFTAGYASTPEQIAEFGRRMRAGDPTLRCGEIITPDDGPIHVCLPGSSACVCGKHVYPARAVPR